MHNNENTPPHTLTNQTAERYTHLFAYILVFKAVLAPFFQNSNA